MLTLASNVPDNSGYVVAAYLVFFTLLVVYLAITAYRLLGLEKRLTDVTKELDEIEGRDREADHEKVEV